MCVPQLPNGAFLRGLLDPRHYAGEGITMIVEIRTYRTKPGMRAFPDLAARERMQVAFYESELWKRELEPVVMPKVEKYDVVVVDDAEETIRW